MEMLIVSMKHSIDESIVIGSIVATRYERGLQHFFRVVKFTNYTQFLPQNGAKGRMAHLCRQYPQRSTPY